MATRLNYAVPIARQLLIDVGRRLRPGGLPASIAASSQGKPFIIVTGAGRSGTSAVARVLHESGICMGTEFDPPSEYNRVGFYEDTGVRSINGQMVGELGLSDIRSYRFPWRSAVLAIAERHQREMRELVSKARDGWKDPLFSVTLEAWLPHLPGRPKVVLCLRSPEAFVHSVTRVYGLVSRRAVERWWASELRRLLDIIRDYRLAATCVAYDKLVQRPEETVAALSSFVGHPLDAKYVEPDLRHFAHAVPRRYASLYEQARALDPRRATAGPPARQVRGIAPLLARLGKRARPTEDEVRAIDGYLERVRAVDSRVATAKADWSDRVCAPRPKLVHYRELGLNSSQVLEETRSASAAYVAALSEVQAELGSLVPPAAFESYHELTRASVDRERLVAQLMLQAADGPHPDRRAVDDAIRAWGLFSSPEAAADAQKRRSREYERALRASSYRAVRPEPPR